MMGDKLNILGLLKNAKKMQENFASAQDALSKLKVTGEAMGGDVTVTVGGDFQIHELNVKPELYQEDTNVVEELIMAAANDALRKVKDETQSRMMGGGGSDLLGDLMGGGNKEEENA